MDIENIPNEVIEVLSRIMDTGAQGYIVGGALRNHILGRPIYDWDIATSLLPEEIESLFSDLNTVVTGKQFGTITVFLAGFPMEITTYRIEDDYMDFRHPSKVAFTSDIYMDLRRRDFTMNAIAFNPLVHRNQLIDPYSGHTDIESGIIRAVGLPGERFSEDPLRMMRAVRFMAELGFEIEDETLSSIVENSCLVRNISAERIAEELNKTLLGEFVRDAMIFLYTSGLQRYIVPESTAYLNPSNLDLIASALPLCSEDILHRLCMYLIWTLDIRDRKPIIHSVLRRLRYDNKTISNVAKVLCTIDMPIFSNVPDIYYEMRKLMGSTGMKNISAILHLRDILGYDSSNAKKAVDDIVQQGDPISKSDLAIDGHDIMNLGIGVENRRSIGRALNMAYDWVLRDPSLNHRNLLIDRLERYNLEHPEWDTL